MTRAHTVLACSLLTICSTAGAISARADSTATGAHFKVVCHFDNESIAKAALATAEAVWPIACELYGLKEAAPEKPLEVHIYRTVKDYEAAEKEKTGGRFRANLSFSFPKEKSAHISMQPACSNATLRQVGLPWLTRLMVAHESAHLFAYSLLPNATSHPDWLSEGLATWIAERTLNKNKWSRNLVECPESSTSTERVRRMKQSGKLPSVEKILSGEPLGSDMHDDYAVYCSLFRFLRTEPQQKRLAAILGEARRLGGGSSYAEQLRAFFEKTVGGSEGLAKFNADFATYVESRKTIWWEATRSLDVQAKQWVQIAFADVNALAWRVQPVGKKSYSLHGSVEILSNSVQQMNVLLGKNDAGFIMVAFTAGYGINVFHYRIAEEKWDMLAAAKASQVVANQAIPFKVSVRGDKVRVVLDNKEIVSCNIGDKDMTGRWGLGAQAGSAGIWRDVKIGD